MHVNLENIGKLIKQKQPQTIRLMDGQPSSSSSPYHYQHHSAYYSQSSSSPSPLQRSNDANDHRHQYAACETNLPPLLPKKKSKLKSPLTAIKNAFIRSTRPLRRQTSMVETEQKKVKPSILKRQYSMLENRNRVRYYDDENYNYTTRHEPFYPREYDDDYRNQNYEHEPIYGFHRDYQREYAPENLYANRALIELERRQFSPRNPPQYGGRIVRRHSLAERSSSYQNQYFSQQHPPENVTTEPIYQTRSGSYMIEDRKQPPGNYNMNYDTVPNRRLMHLDHIYQSKSEMIEKINMSRTKDSIRNDGEYPKTESPNKINEAFRTQSQLREHLYQTRQETMKSMAEPIYISKREFKNEPIYEVKEDNLSKEHQDTVDHVNVADENKNNQEKSLEEDIMETLNKGPYNCELTLSDDQSGADNQNTVIENPLENPNDCESYNNNNIEANICPTSPIGRAPNHILNLTKRTAPMHLIAESQTSIETHYNSQASLIPFGKPNAQSTPYASEISIGQKFGPLPQPPPREPSTTRGIFTEDGGTLSDPIWNVSLVIPKGALPKGLEQEIYFTVTDPRLSEHVGGPPLDMQNGETMLSPLVMCGPQGLEFLTPVTLNIPHCAASTLSFGLSLKATDSEKNLQTNWEDIEIPRNPAAHVVSVKVDHF